MAGRFKIPENANFRILAPKKMHLMNVFDRSDEAIKQVMVQCGKAKCPICQMHDRIKNCNKWYRRLERWYKLKLTFLFGIEWRDTLTIAVKGK